VKYLFLLHNLETIRQFEEKVASIIKRQSKDSAAASENVQVYCMWEQGAIVTLIVTTIEEVGSCLRAKQLLFSEVLNCRYNTWCHSL
jgi:hypothetical protein